MLATSVYMSPENLKQIGRVENERSPLNLFEVPFGVNIYYAMPIFSNLKNFLLFQISF